MTETLYYADSYLKEFSASVTEALPEENGLVLDRTAFFPGGGGQPNDLGSLEFNGQVLPVIKVKWHEHGILHVVDGSLPPAGSAIIGMLDWQRRFQLMRTHTALHILCGVVWRDYGAQVTGGNMEPLRGRMDFEFESLRAEFVKEIEQKVNVEIQQRRSIRAQVLPRAQAFAIPDLIRTKINLLPEDLKEIRTIEIAGLDLQADGGTHVSNTIEVGKILVTGYKSKGKINKRFEIEITD